MIRYSSPWGTGYNIKLVVNQYRTYGNLYIGMLTDEGEPYADLSVNIEPLGDGEIAVDINNLPDGEKFIRDNGLGEFTGKYLRSGFCRYPVYKMNMEAVHKHLA